MEQERPGWLTMVLDYVGTRFPEPDEDQTARAAEQHGDNSTSPQA